MRPISCPTPSTGGYTASRKVTRSWESWATWALPMPCWPTRQISTLTRVSEAVLKLEAEDAKWGDVTAAVRVAVQELRHEYGEDVTTVKVEAVGLVPEWAGAVIQMEPEQLDWVIANLSMVGAIEGV